MRTAFLCISLIAILDAQSVDPTAKRAVTALAETIRQDLLMLNVEADRLIVSAEDSASVDFSRRLLHALADEGFVVALGLSAASGGQEFELRLRAEAHQALTRITVSAPKASAITWVRSFASEAWVDDVGDEALTVLGPRASDPHEALRGARRSAALAVARRISASTDEVLGSRHFDRLLMARFDAREDRDGLKEHRAYLQVRTARKDLKRIEAEVRDVRLRAAREPYLRVGAIVLVTIALGFLYLRTDWRTRGYLTGRLRVTFGILWMIGVGACYGVPLA